ncbi:glyceraldehyde 3-phosphate dehydrogenase, partial [Candidatus Hakubella thermalkaliphila]
PGADGCIVDLVAVLEKDFTGEDVNRAMKEASQSEKYRVILDYTEDPLVSVDVIGNPHSAVFDAQSTLKIGDMVKVLSWYDNEWGFSCRVVDLIKYIAESME